MRIPTVMTTAPDFVVRKEMIGAQGTAAGLEGVVLRQAFGALLTPAIGAGRSLASDTWRSMLADALTDATAKARSAGSSPLSPRLSASEATVTTASRGRGGPT